MNRSLLNLLKANILNVFISICAPKIWLFFRNSCRFYWLKPLLQNLIWRWKFISKSTSFRWSLILQNSFHKNFYWNLWILFTSMSRLRCFVSRREENGHHRMIVSLFLLWIHSLIFWFSNKLIFNRMNIFITQSSNLLWKTN